MTCIKMGGTKQKLSPHVDFLSLDSKLFRTGRDCLLFAYCVGLSTLLMINNASKLVCTVWTYRRTEFAESLEMMLITKDLRHLKR